MKLKKMFLKVFPYSQCPNCKKTCISYWDKIDLIDFRCTHNCRECGNTIRLPSWHILLFLLEVLLTFYLAVKLKLSRKQAIILASCIMFFIFFVQLRLITIKD